MPQVLDSAAHIPAAAAKAAGYVGVARYLSAYTPKAITKAELDADIATGLVVALVYEDGAADMLGGANAGAAHGRVAGQQLAALGVPASQAVVYAAVDTDAPAADFPTIAAALAAFAQASGATTGPYGPAGLCDWWLGEHHGGFAWEAAGWVHGNPTQAQLQQLVQQATVGGVTCDVNNVRAADFGQWPRPSVAPAPAPAPGNGSRYDALVPGYGLPGVPEVAVIGKTVNGSGLAATRNVAAGKTVYAGLGNPTTWHAGFSAKALPAGTPLAVAYADVDFVSTVVVTEQL